MVHGVFALLCCFSKFPGECDGKIILNNFENRPVCGLIFWSTMYVRKLACFVRWDVVLLKYEFARGLTYGSSNKSQ